MANLTVYHFYVGNIFSSKSIYVIGMSYELVSKKQKNRWRIYELRIIIFYIRIIVILIYFSFEHWTPTHMHLMAYHF